MASKRQQFGIRGTIAPRMVNELTKLTSLVRQLAISQYQPFAVVNTCGICTSMEHPTNMCPTFTGSSRMQIGRLRANNLEGHYTSRIQIKGHMQLKDSIQTRAFPKAKAAIDSQIQDTR
ncbi:hypothetical protein CR513_18770, partial [Mucuna pruriens]